MQHIFSRGSTLVHSDVARKRKSVLCAVSLCGYDDRSTAGFTACAVGNVNRPLQRRTRNSATETQSVQGRAKKSTWFGCVVES
jgi:hypothetical protein